ncbi:MAG: GNAT family N-acetyltransferase [Candidatus Eisenbacteria bacterium]|nr:GNAT family N-acetyltransferase [Candidatus Latescibacterota bacterium]MBD3302495.1 GNAT family N-acetyltransferase [Candidatus Eisenbacteria bacterium]
MDRTGKNPEITLRPVVEEDLAVFFAQEQDEEALWMAAFTPKDPTDVEAFRAHWAKVLADETITIRTILHEGAVAGHIVRHSWFGDPEVSYWIGKEHWGKGIATRALAAFLDLVATRPLFARAAKDNAASIRVLEKCGFVREREERGFANARDAEIDELVFRLPGEPGGGRA